MARKKEKQEWKFTKGRRESLKKAQRVHVELVKLGKAVKARQGS